MAELMSKASFGFISVQQGVLILYTLNARRIVKQLLKQSGSQAQVRLKHRFPGGRNVGGKYSMFDHSITLYLYEIRKQCRIMFGSAPLSLCKQLLRIVLAHELGHAQDAQLSELSDSMDACESRLDRSRLALQIEENAWNYARQLLPAASVEMLEVVMEHSLRAYREVLAEEQAGQHIA